MAARHRLRKVGEAVLAAAVLGAAVRAARGGVSGEEELERRKERELRSHELRPDEREQLGAASEKMIEAKLGRLGELEKGKVDALVGKYDACLSRLESEKAGGKVSESTLAELRILPGQIREAVNVSQAELDAVRGAVSKNIAVRSLRSKAVVDVREREYTTEPSLAARVGNVLLGTPATRKHVTEVEETIFLPDRLPTLEQISQTGKLSHLQGELSDRQDSLNPMVLHPEEDHKSLKDRRDASRRKAA